MYVSVRKIRMRVCFFMLSLSVALVSGLLIYSNVMLPVFSGDRVVEFIERSGWQVDTDTLKTGSFAVPEKFDAVLDSYNKLQKEQGFDLDSCRGRRLEKYAYTVLNFPGYEFGDRITANVFVLDGEIVAADICSSELNGFMCGLVQNGENQIR